MQLRCVLLLYSTAITVFSLVEAAKLNISLKRSKLAKLHFSSIQAMVGWVLLEDGFYCHYVTPGLASVKG